MGSLKKLLSNKNVVTLFGVVLIVLVLYLFYNWRINQQVSLVSVPYAKVSIEPRQEITSDMIGYMEVPKSYLNGNVLLNESTQILGMYTDVNVMIPEGSFFYKSALKKFEDLADSFLTSVPDGMVAYNFKVTVKSTYGNSIYPGNYVDVYFKGVDSGNQLIIGKLIENVKVLAVKDSSGQPVFETTTEVRTPDQAIFAVTEEMHELLRAAEYIKDAEIIIVPTKFELEEDGDLSETTQFTSEDIQSYIKQYIK